MMAFKSIPRIVTLLLKQCAVSFAEPVAYQPICTAYAGIQNSIQHLIVL